MDVRNLGSIPIDEVLDCDVCIVGNGPAGGTIVRELANSSLRVILVESGGIDVQPGPGELNEIENVGVARALDQSVVRNRVLGGTSHAWTGRCVGMDEIDYQQRSWVPHSGWPFGPAEMTPYLDRSAPHLGLGVGSGFSGDDFWSVAGRPPPSQPRVDENLLQPFFWQFSRTSNPVEPMRFGRRMLTENPPNVRVVTSATVVHINTDESASEVNSVEVAAPDDSRRTIRSRMVVLCAGGIENARLLLASNRVSSAGLGNGHDVVGRFLMDHPRGSIGTFDPKDAGKLEPYFGFHYVRKSGAAYTFCQGMRLSPVIQEKEDLLNCAVWNYELVAADDPWSAVKRIALGKANWRSDPLVLLANTGFVAKGLRRRLTLGGGMPRKLEGLGLQCTVEQRPDPDSRVTLADRMDRHNMPLSRLDWRVSEQEQHTVRRTTELVVQALAQIHVPAPRPEGWISAGEGFPPTFADVAHHIGTTRMSADPKSGVVDADCQVHGVRGLFVAGSSVFPTADHANPTQMIVALAVRLADTLKQAAKLPSAAMAALV